MEPLWKYHQGFLRKKLKKSILNSYQIESGPE